VLEGFPSSRQWYRTPFQTAKSNHTTIGNVTHPTKFGKTNTRYTANEFLLGLQTCYATNILELLWSL
jgi:hypothetical protein